MASHVKDPELAKHHFSADEVDIELDVFRALVKDWILGHGHQSNIVTVDDHCLGDAVMELAEKVSQPRTLGHSVCDAAVLGFPAGLSHHVMSV